MSEAAPPTFVLRAALPADQPALVRYNLALASETEGKALDPAVVARGVARVFASPATARYHVAEADGQVVAQLMTYDEISDWRDGVIWWLASVYVDPAWRGRGVFTALYRHVEALATAHGAVCNIRLYVEYDNARGMRTYERLGMHRERYHIYDKALTRP